MAKVIFSTFFLLFSLGATLFAQNKSNGSVKTKKYDPTNNLVVWPAAFHPDRAQWYVYNEIEIYASPEVVWQILIDAKKWHTFYKGVESPVVFLDTTANTLQNGLAFKMHTMGQRLVPVMREFVPNERMAWEVQNGNLSAYHAWVIVPTTRGCRLITPESQNGFLTVMQKLFVPNKLLNLHEHWLEVIKARAEETTPTLSALERDKMKTVLLASQTKLMEAVQHLSDTQLNFKNATNAWSIAACLEHITLAELEFPKILEKALQQPANPKMRSKIRIKDEEIQSRMTSSSWKAKSPKRFRPNKQFTDAAQCLATFRAQRSSTLQFIETTKADMRNHYWRHPLTGTIDLYQTLLLLSAHLDRHITQIENIKSSVGFPQV